MLITCNECKSEFSDKAAACPKCGCPNNLIPNNNPALASTTGTSPIKKVKKGFFWIAGTAIAIIIGFWVGLRFFSGEGGAAIANQIVTNAVIPWSDRAESTLKSIVDTENNRQMLANALLVCIHPSGKDSVLSDIQYEKQDAESLNVRFTLDWKGGFIGTGYKSTILWSISSAGHIRSAVESDTAQISVSKEDLERLNDYLKNNFLKSLKESMGEATP